MGFAIANNKDGYKISNQRKSHEIDTKTNVVHYNALTFVVAGNVGEEDLPLYSHCTKLLYSFLVLIYQVRYITSNVRVQGKKQLE